MTLQIDHRLDAELNLILDKHTDTTSSLFWEEYYDFIVMSYNIKNRHGMSSLSKILKEKMVVNQKQLLLAYGHGLFILARFNGEKIYGDGFCV
ncbi:hypothetical protein D3H64_02215 [Atopobacter sp. AH10]|uniref:hypothetical protein n=1 Tax=Atopobacter sp. AH10 TaxID=2315861 RepID=UPI000EF1E94F|nr:hypothetical protein [Atopobacter sp. AH10]RLK63806.1 hypothetical protein D3H64_02215 [Atopobacter sp. AH10]